MTDWDQTADFVIIGSGAGGLCAALVAAHNGHTALVLEKEPVVGGTSARSGGAVWVPCNHLMIRDGIPDTHAEARRYVQACVKEYTNAATIERIDTYLSTGPQMLRFLEAQGIPLRRAAGYSDYYDERPGGKPAGRAVEAKLIDSRQLGEWSGRLNRYAPFAVPMYVSEFAALSNATRTWRGRLMAARLAWRLAQQRWRGSETLGQGAALQGRLLREVLSKGVALRTSTAANRLIMDNGTVVGIAATTAAGSLRVRARSGVLINAGGFAQNLQMRKQFLPGPQETSTYSLSSPGDTGEIIAAAVEIGAALDQMDEAWWIVGSRLPSGFAVSHTIDLTKPHSILVDAKGDRYLNEAMAYMELGQQMHAHYRATAVSSSLAIFDSRHRERYSWGMALPGKTPADWLNSGYMKCADSIAELARRCSIEPQRLQKTIGRFNTFAANGQDEDFKRGRRAYDRMSGDPTCKPNPTLGTIEKPPFYAVEIHIGDVGTCGGLVTDTNARVLRADGSPIGGLYACGNSAANCMGRSYPGPGITLGQSLIFGYRAAHYATAASARTVN